MMLKITMMTGFLMMSLHVSAMEENQSSVRIRPSRIVESGGELSDLEKLQTMFNIETLNYITYSEEYALRLEHPGLVAAIYVSDRKSDIDVAKSMQLHLDNSAKLAVIINRLESTQKPSQCCTVS